MESILGLSLSDRTVQAVEIEHRGPSKTLFAVDEWENTLPIGPAKNGDGTGQFVEYLSAFIRVNKIKTRRISIALDSATLFFNSLPLEDGISRLERNEQMEWELSQYFPEGNAREFITDVHVLTENREQAWTKVLSVSVRRENAYMMQNLVAKLGLNLYILDVDHFGADAALRVNYPDSERKYLALVGVKENRLDVSLIRNGVLESYSYRVVSSNAEIVEHIGALSRETRGLFSITVYGTHLDTDLLVQIRRGSDLLVEALNPLRHVRVPDSLRLSDHLSVPSYRFASAVGVALRRD